MVAPKKSLSASKEILSILKEYLNGEELLEFTWNCPDSGIVDFPQVVECDAIVFAFPLYVDSIPSHLLHNLVNLESYIKKENIRRKIAVYAIANNGFFDGKQNVPALESMEHWCRKCGLELFQGIGIGGGGMLVGVKNVPNDKGPKKNIGNALKNMAHNILAKQRGERLIVLPNFPGIAYKLMAEYGWRKMVKSNGLKPSDLGRRII